MPTRISILWTCLATLVVAAAPLTGQADTASSARVTISGTVYSTFSGKPIPFAIVRVTETDSSAITDRKGRYRMRLPAGESRLEFRQIGFEMTAITVNVVADEADRDVFMNHRAIALEPVVITDTGESRANRIMRRAIARKNDLLARIHDYRYDAYVKLVITDLGKDEDSAEAVLLITETETTAYWEQPDKYQEVITGRRQSSNLDAENNLVTVGQIANFNRNRIDLEKYAIVSPTADDALDHYSYHLVDSLFQDGNKVFRLAIVPHTAGAPLFVGMIDIADSTYDVLSIDVGFNEAVRFDFFENLRYRQRLRDYGDDHWMPSEITFSGEIRFGIPIPGVPKRLAFNHQASLEDFRFDQGNLPSDIGTFLLVVDEAADDGDSTAWNERRSLNLSDLEQRAYARIDSIRSEPASLGTRVMNGTLIALFLSTNPDFFRFNRTESVYLGAGWTWLNLSPKVTLRTKLGYSFGRKAWQYELGGEYRLSARHGVWLGGSYHNGVVSRPTIVSYSYNPTYLALMVRLDPLDYFQEEGFTLRLRGRLFGHTELALQYNDFGQTSIPVVTDYSIFNVDRTVAANPPITDGRMRSTEATLTYDSRPLYRQKGRDFRVSSLTYTQVTVGVELSSPKVMQSDFDFGRYFVQLKRRQRTFNWGLTTIDAYAGVSSGQLPPQRYIVVDFGKGAFFEEGGFSTMQETNFFGNRAAMLVVSHNFDRMLVQKSGIPFVETLPFTIAVHGGLFWTDFVNQTDVPGLESMATAPHAYSEIGFGIGNLTPFTSPLNMAIYFSWQLSSYPTRGFQFRIGVPTPG